MISHNNSLIFKTIDKDDIKELYELLNGLTNQSKRFFHPHPFDKETIAEICTSNKDYYFVMRLKNILIGYSFLRLFGHKIPSFGCCIRNGYENKGYGTILTELTLNKAKDYKFEKVILKLYKQNIVAFNIYKKIGFNVVSNDRHSTEIKMEIYVE